MKFALLISFALLPFLIAASINYTAYVGEYISGAQYSYYGLSLDKPAKPAHDQEIPKERKETLESSPTTDLVNNRNYLGNLSHDLQYIISSYLIDPVYTLGSLNKSSRINFTEIYPLKHYFDIHFNIPEFANVDKNEPELHGILSLTWCKNDPFLFIISLMEDLLSGKKPYKNLFRPLVLYLSRTLKEVPENQQWKYYNRSNYYLYELAKICAKNCHFDLIFNIYNGADNYWDLTEIIKCDVDNREELMNFFKSNPDLAMRYRGTFMLPDPRNFQQIFFSIPEYYARWISDCLIYDAPEAFYSELINRFLNFFYPMYEECFIREYIIPESEFARIHFKMDKFIKERELCSLDTNSKYLFRMMNDFLFGPNNPEQEAEFMSLNIRDLNFVFFGEAAMFANKKSLFLACRAKYASIAKDGNDLIADIMDKYWHIERIKTKKCFKIMFEVIASDPQIIKDTKYLFFVLKFYALKHFKIEGKQGIFEFVALQDLLDLGFPPSIQAEIKGPFGYLGDYIFDFMQVTDEETFASFMADYEKYSNSSLNLLKRYEFPIDSELFNFIANSPKSIELLKSKKMMFYPIFSYDNFKSFYDWTIIERMSPIMRFEVELRDNLTKLTSKKQLKLAEELNVRKTVGEQFLELESKQRIDLFDYFKWRFVFKYWINGDQKEEIKNIKSREILKLLRMEFPEEMNKIIGTEKEKK